MPKKLKLTFERGGVIYAVLNEKDAPNMTEQFCATLPRTDDMLHGRYAGPAMFINTGLEDVTAENLVSRKWVGMMTVTLGNRNHPQHAMHVFYSYRREIVSHNDEIYLAQVEDKYFPLLEEIGERVWGHCPEKVTIELAEGEE